MRRPWRASQPEHEALRWTYRLGLVVLDEAAEGTLRGAKCAVQHVDVHFPRLVLGLQTASDLEPAAL